MAYVPNRDDPFLPTPSPSIEEMRRRDRMESEFQADPELTEGPASRTRVALYAIAILAVLGALFYGLNTANNSSQTASNTPTPPSSTSPAQPRSATPSPNTAPGTTTGQAPSAPAPTK